MIEIPSWHLLPFAETSPLPRDGEVPFIRFGLKPEAIEKICKVFSAYPQIQQVLVYGSRAKGTQRDGSDIDLAIQGDITLPQLLKIENALDDLLLPYHIDLSLMHHIDDPKLLEHIRRVGKFFYAK